MRKTVYKSQVYVKPYTKADGTKVEGYYKEGAEFSEETAEAPRSSQEEPASPSAPAQTQDREMPSRSRTEGELGRARQDAAKEVAASHTEKMSSLDEAYDDALTKGTKREVNETRQAYISYMMENEDTLTAQEKGDLAILQEKDYLQNGTRAVAFKNWFGDWESGEGSKAVDASGRPEKQLPISRAVDSDGEPIIVFHGTTHDFDEFSSERANRQNSFGPGHYFTTDSSDVERNYAGEGPDLTARIGMRAEQITSQGYGGIDSMQEEISAELSKSDIDVTDGIDDRERSLIKEIAQNAAYDNEMPDSVAAIVAEDILSDLSSGTPADEYQHLEEHHVAEEAARKELKGSEARTIKAYLNARNPITIGSNDQSTEFYVEFDEDEDLKQEYNDKIVDSYIEQVASKGGDPVAAEKIARNVLKRAANPMDFANMMSWDADRVATEMGHDGDDAYTDVDGLDDIAYEWEDNNYGSREYSGDAARLLEAVESVVHDYDYESYNGADSIREAIQELIADEGPDGSFNAEDVVKAIAGTDAMPMDYDEPEAGSVQGELIANIFKEMGYDSIQDTTPARRFPGMGIGENDHHWIVFEPEQIKSVDNNGAFSKRERGYRKSMFERKSLYVKPYTKSDGTKVEGYYRQGSAAASEESKVKFRQIKDLMDEAKKLEDSANEAYKSGQLEVGENLDDAYFQKKDEARDLRRQLSVEERDQYGDWLAQELGLNQKAEDASVKIKEEEDTEHSNTVYGENAEAIEAARSLLFRKSEYTDRVLNNYPHQLFTGYTDQPKSIQWSLDNYYSRAFMAVERVKVAQERGEVTQELVDRSVGAAKDLIRVHSQWESVTSNPLDVNQMHKWFSFTGDNKSIKPLAIRRMTQAYVKAYDDKVAADLARADALNETMYPEMQEVLDRLKENNYENKEAAQAEIKAIREKYSYLDTPVDEAFDKLREAHSKLQDAIKMDDGQSTSGQATIKEGLEADYNIRTTSITESTFGDKERASIERSVEDVSQMLNRNVWGDKFDFIFSPDSDDARPRYSRNAQTSILPGSSNPSYFKNSAWHEMGHALEYASPAAMYRANEFISQRIEAAGTEPVSMKDKFGGMYGENEIGNEDSFRSVAEINSFNERDIERSASYNGKRYEDGATEVISMGLEHMASDAAWLAKKDYKYFLFMVGILNGQLLMQKE